MSHAHQLILKSFQSHRYHNHDRTCGRFGLNPYMILKSTDSNRPQMLRLSLRPLLKRHQYVPFHIKYHLVLIIFRLLLRLPTRRRLPLELMPQRRALEPTHRKLAPQGKQRKLALEQMQQKPVLEQVRRKPVLEQKLPKQAQAQMQQRRAQVQMPPTQVLEPMHLKQVRALM